MPKLIIIRGNSGSGKGTIAQALRCRMGDRTALVGQDHFRRIVLKEKDAAGGDNIALIAQTVEFALQRGYDTILEGILAFSRYGPMLKELIATWENSYVYYLDVSFEETLRRHATKSHAHEFGETEMRRWWIERDLTGFACERLLPEDYSVEQSVASILRDIG